MNHYGRADLDRVNLDQTGWSDALDECVHRGVGEIELRMTYCRPWEDASPIQAFSHSIAVG